MNQMTERSRDNKARKTARRKGLFLKYNSDGYSVHDTSTGEFHNGVESVLSLDEVEKFLGI